MRSRIIISMLLAAGVFAVTAGAQEGAAPAVDMPELKPVISYIPSGTAGYVVVNDVKSCTDKIDKFLADAGLSQIIAMSMGGGPGGQNGGQMPGVLQMLQGAAQLGQGFNPNGGFAAVMLNPEDYDLDIVGMIKAEMEPGPSEGPEVQFKDVPFVMIVPGKGIKEVFGAYEIIPGGKYTQVKLRMGTVMADEKQGYVFLSPNEKALGAVLSARGSAVGELPKPEAELMAASDIAANVNVRTIRPMLLKMVDMIGEKMKEQSSGRPGVGGMSAPLAPFALQMKMADYYTSIYKEIFKQTDSMTLAGRFVDTGLVAEGMATFTEGSDLAGSIKVDNPGAKKLLNRLPNLPYVLAMGAAGNAMKNPVAEDPKEQINMAVNAIASAAEGKLSDEDKAKMKKIFLGLQGQVTGVQFAGGGAPAGSGLFGLSMVIDCKSAAKLKALMTDGVDLGNSLIQTADDPDFKQLQLSYAKGVETVEQTPVDTIEFTHPEMAEEDDKDKMVKVLGEDKVRIFVAEADKDTLVLTFGGSRAFLGESIKLAKTGGGTILQGPDSAEALKYMPKNTSFIMLFNGGNLLDVIKTAKNTMAPDSQPIPFQITCKTPIAVGAGGKDNTGHMALYMPSGLIKDLTGVFMGLMMPRPGPMPPPQPQGEQDF